MAHADVLWIKKLDYPVGWGIRGHSHDYRQLFFITDGQGYMQVVDVTFPIQTGSCILIKPHEHHRMPCTENGCVEMYDVKFRVSDEYLSSTLDRLSPCFQTNLEEILPLLKKVRQNWKDARRTAYPGRYEAAFAKVYFEEILYLLLQEQLSPTLPDETDAISVLQHEFPGVAGKIADYLEQHYTEEISLDSLSEYLAYNRNYLCNVFKTTTGHTIQNYVKLLRISKATDLICNSHRSLSEIAFRVGFKDIHHFNRVYKMVTGQTPGAIRSQAREDICSDVAEHGEFLYRYYAAPGQPQKA